MNEEYKVFPAPFTLLPPPPPLQQAKESLKEKATCFDSNVIVPNTKRSKGGEVNKRKEEAMQQLSCVNVWR